MRTVAFALALSTAVLPAAAQSAGARLPTRIGQCAATTITKITDRFGRRIKKTDADGLSGGSLITYRNGGVQVAYDVDPAVIRSRQGDRVLLCLVSIPKDCPKGDDRGKVYTATNLRLQESWTMQDSSHLCGGA